MKRVCFWWSNRSEEGLILPVYREMERSSLLKPYRLEVKPLHPEILGYLYNEAYQKLMKDRPDLLFLGFDRYETLMVASAAHHLNIPIAQMEAGDISLEGSWDDWTRHAITLLSDIQFCNGSEAYHRCIAMLELAGKRTDLCFEVGSTALDDVEVDESLCPEEPYVLVLYNPPTRRPDLLQEELDELERKLEAVKEYRIIAIEPNGDPGSEVIEMRAKIKWRRKFPKYTYLPTLERSKFLGLMKNCKYFIGNSSSLFKEAPAFLKEHQIIHIGVRNKGRRFLKPELGASKKIVRIIERIFREGKL